MHLHIRFTKFLHIRFTNGSNTWFRTNMTQEQLDQEINNWSKNYIINHRDNRNDGVFLTVTEKE